MKPEKFGKYTLLGRLGKGGMAEVFLARAESVDGFQKLLAVKRLLSPFNRDEHVISMLADEARLSVWLNHANIVQVLDFGRVGQTYYLAMEYVDGCDLCDLIRIPRGASPRPLPLATALYVMAQVTDALSYAHHRQSNLSEPLGIVHRDVSPHNILISREGQVKLADFGLARASISTHFSTADVIRGKFSYMPKEQANGLEIDHRIDIFGAGVTLYEALTGVKPYSSSTLAEQLYQLEQPVPPPSAHVPDITPEVDQITMRAMQPDPEHRYNDAGDMAEDLLDILDGFSTFNLEANQLSALVANLVGQMPREIQRLPSMSINDIALTDGSLIADAVEQVRQAGVPGPDDVAMMPDLEAEMDLSADEEGDTNEFQNNAVAAQSAGTDSFDALKTVALIDDQEPASSLPPVALSHAGVGRLPPTEEMAAQAGDVISGVLPDEHLVGDHGVGKDPKVTLSPSMVEEWAPGAEPIPPYDTLRDPEEAGRQARQAVDADEAATIQRSPEEMLTHFNRALEEKERRAQLERQQRRRRILTALGIVLGAVVLFAVGIFLGRYMSGTPTIVTQPQPPPAPPREAPPSLPPKGKLEPAPKKVAAAVVPTTGDAGARPARDASSARDTAVASATRREASAQPDADPKTETKTALKTSKTPRKKVRRKRPRRPRPLPPPPQPGKIEPAPDPDEIEPPPSSTGFLTVMCDSPARVYVDDASSARPAPLIKMALTPGSHRVRVYFEKARTFSDTQWVFIKGGQTFSLSFSAPSP